MEKQNSSTYSTRYSDAPITRSLTAAIAKQNSKTDLFAADLEVVDNPFKKRKLKKDNEEEAQ